MSQGAQTHTGHAWEWTRNMQMWLLQDQQNLEKQKTNQNKWLYQWECPFQRRVEQDKMCF